MRRLGLLIGNHIDLRAVDGAQQASSVIVAGHLLAHDVGHGRFGSIGDHFDGVVDGCDDQRIVGGKLW